MNFGAQLKVKAVVFLNNIVPYHHARWRSSADFLSHCVLAEITNCDEFKTLEVGLKSAGAYDRVTLFPGMKLDDISQGRLAEAVRCLLDREMPDVIFVSGYSFHYNWIALEWGLSHGVPIVICSESNEHDEPRKALKESIKRFFVSRCAAGLAGGTPQAAYLEKLGISREHLCTGYDVVDNGYFELESKKARSGGNELRAKLKLPAHYFFACARFGKKKNLPFLIESYADYRRKFSDSHRGFQESIPWDLVIAGDGEERRVIERTIRECGVEEYVHLIGPKGYDALPVYYALAETFIHASTTEQWGLVVNEAMACGLPVLVSSRCGCVPDLLEEGKNGWSFDPVDQDQLSSLMMKISKDSALMRGMSMKSREIIANWGESRFASGAIAAVEASRNASVQKFGLIERLMFKFMTLR